MDRARADTSCSDHSVDQLWLSAHKRLHVGENRFGTNVSGARVAA